MTAARRPRRHDPRIRIPSDLRGRTGLAPPPAGRAPGRAPIKVPPPAVHAVDPRVRVDPGDTRCRGCRLEPGRAVSRANVGTRPLLEPGPGDVIVCVLREQHFDFTYLQVGTATLPLLGAYPVHDFSCASLVLRLHHNAIDVTSAGSTVNVYAYATAPSPYDPREFRRGEEDISVGFSHSDAAPALLVSTITAINGPFYTLELVANEARSLPFAFQISLDLVLRATP